MVLLLSSMCRRLYRCYNGLVAFIALASLPTLHGRCLPCCASVIVFIVLTSSPHIAWALLLLLHQRCCPIKLACLRCCVGVVPLSHGCCHPWYTGISTLVTQASLPLLCFCCAVDSQASSPLLSWHVLSHGQRGRPHQRQQQHQGKKGNNTSTLREAIPAQ
jgi:hypothetical protein